MNRHGGPVRVAGEEAAQGLTLGAATVEVTGTALATMTAPLVKVN